MLKFLQPRPAPARLEHGFRLLSRDDQEFLRVWFRIPDRTSVRDACRILHNRAPSALLDDIMGLSPRLRPRPLSGSGV